MAWSVHCSSKVWNFWLVVQVLEAEPYTKDSKELALDTWGKVTGLWTTSSMQTLLSLDDFHIWNEAYLRNRHSWRAQQPVTILELQCFRTSTPMKLQNKADIWGCFSFAELLTHPGSCLEGLEAVLPQDVYWEKQKALRTALCRAEVHAIIS